MTQSKEQGGEGAKKDARWPQAEQANDAIGGEEGQEEQDCGREGNWEKKLVTSPGISGDTWDWTSKILAAPANQSESAVPCSAVGTEALTCLLPD